MEGRGEAGERPAVAGTWWLLRYPTGTAQEVIRSTKGRAVCLNGIDVRLCPKVGPGNRLASKLRERLQLTEPFASRGPFYVVCLLARPRLDGLSVMAG